MTKPKSELEELKELQKESQRLRQKQEIPAVESAAVAEVIIAEAPASGAEEAGETPADSAELVEDLTGSVENMISELEEAASEHPALALLAAFGIGIFVGQLLSRR